GGSIPPLATRLFTQLSSAAPSSRRTVVLENLRVRGSFPLFYEPRHHRFGLRDGADMGPNELPSPANLLTCLHSNRQTASRVRPRCCPARHRKGLRTCGAVTVMDACP